jgi:hypothetical protein
MVAVALASSMTTGAAAAPTGGAPTAAAQQPAASRPGHDPWSADSNPAAGMLMAILLSLPLWGGIYALGRLTF